jgi:hypothetical protein
MRAFVTIAFLLAAIVNLFPVLGVLSTARLEALYGVPIADPNLAVLMRHRALLFGIVGALLAIGAFHPPLRPLAGAAGFVSMLSFVALALGAEHNPLLRRVLWVDVAASLVLAAGLALDQLGRAR